MLNIVETIIATPSLVTMQKVIQSAEWSEMLSRPGPFTVFAPTQEAFGKLPGGSFEHLLKDLPMLQEMLAYHIVEGQVTEAELRKYPSMRMLRGNNVGIALHNGIKINQANLIQADIICKNGVIHILDAVLALPHAKYTAV